MAPLLASIRKTNGLGQTSLAEPFAGGAGASLTLLYLEETPEIYINDFDGAIHDFWWAVVHRPQPFLDLLSSTRVNMAEWRRQRDAYRTARLSRLRRGFAAFYLNRCNRSGIIMNGGPIGGVKQTGVWKLSARFNKAELARRCVKVAEYRDRIHVSGSDGLAFVEHASANTMLFIDPPYFHKGDALYLNKLDDAYHGTLAEQLRTMKDRAWVLTYDDCPEVRRLYSNWAAIRPYGLRYAARDRRSGKELFITPRWMQVPESQPSLALSW